MYKTLQRGQQQGHIPTNFFSEFLGNFKKIFTHLLFVKSSHLIDEGFVVPKNIQEKVDKRGWYLYQWITLKDIQVSMDRDLLRLLLFGAIPFWMILFVLSMMIPGILSVGLFSSIGTIFFIIIINIIYRGVFLIKNSLVLITNEYILINGTKFHRDDISNIEAATHKISHIFQEPIFQQSQNYSTKEYFKNFIRNHSSTLSPVFLFIIIPVILYMMIYAIVYQIIAPVSFIFYNINRHFLGRAFSDITHIDNLFTHLDEKIELLDGKNKILKNEILQAHDLQWGDDISDQVNKSFDSISVKANKIIEISNDIKHTIIGSEYQDIFDFETFSKRLAHELSQPLEGMKVVVESARNDLINARHMLQEQIDKQNEGDLDGPVHLQYARIERQLGKAARQEQVINSYLQKLEL